jgi:hypothetical protein
VDRELLLELGCEEIPASWLPSLTNQVGEVLAAQLRERRLAPETPVETYSTPRRLMVRIARIPERQVDFEELITGPPASAPEAAIAGFAAKQGVDASMLEAIETPERPLAFAEAPWGRPRSRGPAPAARPAPLGAMMQPGRDAGRRQRELPPPRPIPPDLAAGGRVVPPTIRAYRRQAVSAGGQTLARRPTAIVFRDERAGQDARSRSARSTTTATALRTRDHRSAAERYLRLGTRAAQRQGCVSRTHQYRAARRQPRPWWNIRPSSPDLLGSSSCRKKR